MRSRDRAYIAGFLDGEGHVSVIDKRIHIYQKDPKVLYWIQKKLGYGNICWSGNCHILYIPAARRREFLDAVIPYVHVKRRDCLRLRERV